METTMTSRAAQADAVALQEGALSLLQLWQLPIAIGMHWLSLMLEAAAVMPPHPLVSHHQPHDQLTIPPEIEVESEQCLFA